MTVDVKAGVTEDVVAIVVDLGVMSVEGGGRWCGVVQTDDRRLSYPLCVSVLRRLGS